MMGWFVCVSSAIASCDECSCGNGTFGTGHCCVSNGDCISGDICSAGLCEPSCDECSCGNGTFPTAHCCTSNGDCISPDTCQAGLCEPAVPSCTEDFCNANDEQNCGTICFDGVGTQQCAEWCMAQACCNGGGFTPGVDRQKRSTKLDK